MEIIIQNAIFPVSKAQIIFLMKTQVVYMYILEEFIPNCKRIQSKHISIY